MAVRKRQYDIQQFSLNSNVQIMQIKIAELSVATYIYAILFKCKTTEFIWLKKLTIYRLWQQPDV